MAMVDSYKKIHSLIGLADRIMSNTSAPVADSQNALDWQMGAFTDQVWMRLGQSNAPFKDLFYLKISG